MRAMMLAGRSRRWPAWQTRASHGDWSDRGFRVQNNARSGSAGPQHIAAWSYRHWQVRTRQPDDGGAVQTYPDVEVPLLPGPRGPLRSLLALRFTYAETMPRSGFDAEAAADIWLNSGSTHRLRRGHHLAAPGRPPGPAARS